MRISIPKDIVANQEIHLVVEVEGDPIATVVLFNDEWHLAYIIHDEADLDHAYDIEGHLPQYFVKKAG